MFALANIASEHGLEDQPQGESCTVAKDLTVAWRIAMIYSYLSASIGSTRVARRAGM